jgi:hypothetical protein
MLEVTQIHDDFDPFGYFFNFRSISNFQDMYDIILKIKFYKKNSICGSLFF